MCVDFNCSFQMFAFNLFGKILIIDPTPAMAADFVSRFHCRFRDDGIAFEGHGDGEKGDWYFIVLKQTHEAPHTHAAAVFVYRFHAHMSHVLARLGADNFREERFGCLISMQNGVFTTLFIIDYELNRDPRIIWPLRVWGRRCIAGHVPRVGGGHLEIPYCITATSVKTYCK